MRSSPGAIDRQARPRAGSAGAGPTETVAFHDGKQLPGRPRPCPGGAGDVPPGCADTAPLAGRPPGPAGAGLALAGRHARPRGDRCGRLGEGVVAGTVAGHSHRNRPALAPDLQLDDLHRCAVGRRSASGRRLHPRGGSSGAVCPHSLWWSRRPGPGPGATWAARAGGLRGRLAGGVHRHARALLRLPRRGGRPETGHGAGGGHGLPGGPRGADLHLHRCGGGRRLLPCLEGRAPGTRSLASGQSPPPPGLPWAEPQPVSALAETHPDGPVRRAGCPGRAGLLILSAVVSRRRCPLRRTARSRPGLSALEVVMTTGALLPLAALFYWMLERAVEHYFFLLGNSVGSPYL